MSYRKRFCLVFTVFFMLTLFSGFTFKSNKYYSMYINDKKVGTVQFAAHGLSIYDSVISEIQKEYKDNEIITAEVNFSLVNDDSLTSEFVIAENIKEAIDISKSAYAIVVDNTVTCHVGSESIATDIVTTIMEELAYKTDENCEPFFKEKVEIKEEISPITSIIEKEKALDLILTGCENPLEYEVKEGEALWDIAVKHNISVDDILAANPKIDQDLIRPGQKLSLTEVNSYVTVITEFDKKVTEDIDYKTVYKEDSSMYKGETKTLKKGQKGEKELNYHMVYENGSLLKKELISEKIVKEPEDQIKAKGTKSLPSRAPVSRNGVEMTPWFGGAENIFRIGMVAKITHVDSGLTFYAKRRGGNYHADSEPLTSADTAIMKRIYGSWSWSRKAIIVEVNGKKMAASMNGMPHGGQYISSNGFYGHFCIHFYGSKGHSSGRVDSQHQAMVRHAAGLQ